MKHTFRTIVVAAMAMLTVAFVGCSKEESNNSDNRSANGGSNGGGGPVPDGWVDLGLPSGLLWAECNLGATSPEDYGEYFAWGEIQPKSVYDWSTYAYGSASHQLTKYCSNSNYGRNGLTDNLITLQPTDDAATVLLGDGARIPTTNDWRELIDNTTAEMTTYGRIFTATNGNAIFLPAAGYRDGSALNNAGAEGIGYYWSASLYTTYPYNAWMGYFTCFGYGGFSFSYIPRSRGHSIRAVRAR